MEEIDHNNNPTTDIVFEKNSEPTLTISSCSTENAVKVLTDETPYSDGVDDNRKEANVENVSEGAIVDDCKDASITSSNTIVSKDDSITSSNPARLSTTNTTSSRPPKIIASSPSDSSISVTCTNPEEMEKINNSLMNRHRSSSTSSIAKLEEVDEPIHIRFSDLQMVRE
eukprot:Pgem_evm1s9514